MLGLSCLGSVFAFVAQNRAIRESAAFAGRPSIRTKFLSSKTSPRQRFAPLGVRVVGGPKPTLKLSAVNLFSAVIPPANARFSSVGLLTLVFGLSCSGFCFCLCSAESRSSRICGFCLFGLPAGPSFASSAKGGFAQPPPNSRRIPVSQSSDCQLFSFADSDGNVPERKGAAQRPYGRNENTMRRFTEMTDLEQKIRLGVGSAAAASAIFAPLGYRGKSILTAIAAGAILTGIYKKSPIKHLIAR